MHADTPSYLRNPPAADYLNYLNVGAEVEKPVAPLATVLDRMDANAYEIRTRLVSLLGRVRGDLVPDTFTKRADLEQRPPLLAMAESADADLASARALLMKLEEVLGT